MFLSNCAVSLTLVSGLCVCFKALLDQLQEAGTSGETVPSENLGKLLDEAQRMVKEMEDRDFTPQKIAAEDERKEAKKCK